MKKNKMMRIASVLLVAVLLSTCAISGTYAKYTSSVDITGSANIATWAFKVGDNSIFAESATFTLTPETGDYTNVSEDTPAPGTKGSFTFVLTNESDVAATYSLAFSYAVKKDNSTYNVKLKFYSDDSYSTEKELTATNGVYSISGESIPIASTDDEDANQKIVTIYWEWPFETGSTDDEKATANKADTDAALAEAKIYLDVDLTVVQDTPVENTSTDTGSNTNGSSGNE